MKRKITSLTTAIIVLCVMLIGLPGIGWGQTRTAILTSDLNWGTPQISENFNSVSATSTTSSSNTNQTLNSGYGVFNKVYVGKSCTSAIENTNTFGSNIMRLTSGSGSPLIASITTYNNSAVSFATKGAFSIKIAKTNYGYFGIYGADDNNNTSAASNSIYLGINDGALTIFNGGTANSIGSYLSTDIIEVHVVYNNTNAATTYGNEINLAAKAAHIYVNGACVMNGNNPKSFTIGGTSLTVFRVCTKFINGNAITIDDLNIYDALPTAASSDPEVTVSTDEITGFSYGLGQGPSVAQTFTVSGANLDNDIDISIIDDNFELSLNENGTYSGSLSLTPTDGTVAETTVYVRMVAGLDAGDVSDYVLIESDAADEDIELSGEVVPIHTLTYSATHGSISGVLNGTSTVVASGALVAEGGEVDLTADPADNYRFASWEVSGTSSTLSSTTTNPTTFTMGTADATVTATFTRVYAVTCATGLANGSIESDVDEAAENDIVTITATPASGYMFNTITVDLENGGSIDENDIEIEGNTAMFAMPADNVTVSATFTEFTATFTAGVYEEPLNSEESFSHMKIVNVEGTNTWFLESGSKSSKWTVATMSGQSSGDIDWLITPKMPVENGKLHFEFDIWHNTTGQLSVKWSTSNDIVHGTWTDLAFTEGANNNTHTVTDVPTIETDADNIYVAFVYDNVGSKYDAGEYSVSNIVAKQYYNVTFDKNNNAATGEMSALSCLTNTATALPANEFELEDYVFEGWAETADGEAVYEDEDDITITSNTTLYAKWLPSYSVTYYSNNGMGSNMIEKYANGATVTVAENPFTYAGHLFKEWRTNSDGSGTKYEPNDEFNIEDNVDLYAIWDEACTIAFNSNGLQHDEVKVKNSAFSLSAPNNIPEGYAYRGWTLNPESPSTMVGASYTPTGDVTLYAVFGSVTYGNYSRITSTNDITDGRRYLIAYETGAIIFDGSLESFDANNNCQSVSISSNTITRSDDIDSYSFTIEKSGDNYIIKSASGYYIGATSNSNSLLAKKETVYTNSISFSSNDVTIVGSGGAYMRCNSGNSRFRYYQSGTYTNQAAIQLYKQSVSDPSGYYTSVSAPVASNVTITTPTIITSGTVLNMGNHTLTNSSAANLIIEDGGQLIASNSVAATVKKTIANAGAKDASEHWYTIASPVNDGTNNYIGINNTNTVNLTADSYDMFAYDEKAGMWLNQKEGSGANGFDKMYKGQGYLYRNSGNELSFVGNTNSGEVTYTLEKENTGDLAGFNLIGNPYPHDITLKYITYSKGENLNGCYILSDAGAWGSQLDGDATISSYQGFLVQADVDDKVATFHETAQRGAKSNGDNIKFIVANSEYSDATYALFDDCFGLSKINHRNAAIPMLYINQEDADYAIATMSDDTKSFNLNFKAMTTGKYTLSYKADGNFSYLHIIDRLTGEDVDMLLEGEYSFIASPSDAENRFIVRLEYSAGSEGQESSVFAYQSGNDIIVNGEGELQIFDMMGRRVSTQYVSGVETINLQLNGVYIFRLNEKTQKIVVK